MGIIQILTPKSSVLLEESIPRIEEALSAKDYVAKAHVELEKQTSDAFVIMYSVVDKASFRNAEEYLINLHDRGILRSRTVILVGNKMDLVRSRAVSLQDGKRMACTYRVKFIEISVAINHNIDDLLVGILNQIRLKTKSSENRDGSGDTSIGNESHWYRSRIMIRASMKARQMLTWLFGKENSKFKNCENFHIL
ncbi:hypothetical protein PV325_006575 [Microctonus aethiopoides]|uniref:Uncharacterized protein n=1 Tax=Microctonus aethiopoides TaxID=144406 RepID=A0AA39F9Y7_9HYME|nr:hypothetical protein PV325_006575 [Microctonus aethiopoides]KAK0080255.1 hypothetical protein PV326_008272 [Microctonus aethiopoides]KAK0165645.1 hypothetical protein PV328_004147 [Microctonus aethiopoides]